MSTCLHVCVHARARFPLLHVYLRLTCTFPGQWQVLMSTYGMMFNRMGTTCAQVLITESDLLSRDRYSYLTGTLERLMELKAIPIINE